MFLFDVLGRYKFDIPPFQLKLPQIFSLE